MDTGLDEDEPKLGVAVFPVCLEVLADGNRLFDEVPEVLRDGWAKSYPQTKRYIWNKKVPCTKGGVGETSEVVSKTIKKSKGGGYLEISGYEGSYYR